MKVSFLHGVAAAAVLLGVLAMGPTRRAEAIGAGVVSDLIELDLGGFTGCFDYAVLNGKSIDFTCGSSKTTVMDEGSTGRSLSLSGRWRVTCSDGQQRYSNPYTYRLVLAATSGPKEESGVWGRSPCPDQPYGYFGATVYQQRFPYGSGYHFKISVTNTWRYQM